VPALSMVFDLMARDGASPAFRMLGREIEATAKKSEATSAAIGKHMKAIGAASALALLAIGAESIKAAAGFQQSTNIYVTAANETTKGLAAVRDGLMKIAADTGTPMKELTDGMYLIEKAGYTAAKGGLEILRAASQGAKEEGASLSAVVGASTAIIKDYGLKASDAVMVTNQMKTAAGEAKSTFEQFDVALGIVVPAAANYKISFADVAGALAEMTQHGISAQEGAQQLGFAMRNLQAPNNVAAKEMAQFGINANDVSQKLGDGPGGRGLVGTLNYLSDTVLKRMGPAGLVLLTTFNQSKIAAADAQRMFEALPPAAQKVAEAYRSGSLTFKDFRDAAGGLSAAQGALVKQWATSEQGAHGFQQALKTGVNGSQTYSKAIKDMTGGANGLNATLLLTGPNAKGANDAIQRIAESAKNAGHDVNGWASTLELTTTQADRLKESMHNFAILLGDKLLPVATAVFGTLADHPGVVKALAFGIGTLLVAATVAWTAALLANPVGAVVAGLMLLAGTVIYLWQHFQTFRDIVTTVFRVVSDVISGAIIAYLKYFKWFGDTVFSVAESVGHILLNMAEISDRIFGTHLAGAVSAGLGHMEAFRAGFDGAMNNVIGGVQDMRDKVNATLNSLDGKKIAFSVTADGVVNAAGFAAGGGAAKLGAAARFGFAEGGVLPSSATIQPAVGGRGLVQWAEPSTHGEAFIPLNPSKRDRSVSIWQQTGRLLGQFADGGFMDRASGPIRTGLRDFAREVEAAVAQAAQAGAKSAAAAAASAGGSYGGSPGGAGGAGRWAGVVLQALGMLGQPSSLLAGVLSLINSESGGNANAINLTDSNAVAGHPSRGLMQTIPGTFEAYRSQALVDNIVDPLANIYAGINYALRNYGPGMLAAGGRHSSGGGYLGYDAGGILPHGGAGWNTSGRPERVLTGHQTDLWERITVAMERGGGRQGSPLVGTVHVHDNVGLDLVLRDAQFRELAGSF